MREKTKRQFDASQLGHSQGDERKERVKSTPTMKAAPSPCGEGDGAVVVLGGVRGYEGTQYWTWTDW